MKTRHGVGPLRVLHVMDGLGTGGAEVQLALLLRHLPRDRFEHIVCHVAPRAELAPRLREAGASVFDLSRHGRRSLVSGIARLVHLARIFRPVLIHTDGLYANLYGRIAGTILRVPVLTTVGNTVAVVAGRLPTWGARWYFALAAANAITARGSRHFLAISDAVRDSLIRAYRIPAGKITVVRRGLDLRLLHPAPASSLEQLRRDVAPAEAWPLLLNVGRLTRQKGQEYLIRALPEIRRHLPRVHLLLVGEGPLEARYREIAAQAGAAGAVSFPGRRPDVGPLLQCADIFVFPSLWEGTGVSLLEAMAWGKPIVASRIPAIVETAGSVGRLVPPRNPSALAAAIVDVAGQRDRWADLGAAGQRAVDARFDIRRNAAEFGRLLEQIATGTSATAAPPPAPAGRSDRAADLRRSES